MTRTIEMSEKNTNSAVSRSEDCSIKNPLDLIFLCEYTRGKAVSLSGFPRHSNQLNPGIIKEVEYVVDPGSYRRRYPYCCSVGDQLPAEKN